MRVVNLAVVAAFELLLHYALIVPYLQQHGIEVLFPAWHILALIMAVVCLAAGGNCINDYFDQQADRINRPDEQVVGSGVPRRAALLAHVMLTILGLCAGAALSYALRRLDFLLLFVGVAIALWFYSTTFKKQILIGNLVVALLVALTGYMVVAVDYTYINMNLGLQTTNNEPYSTLWTTVCAYAFFAFLSTLGREVIKDLEDSQGDQAVGARTLAVELGPAYTKAVVLLVEGLLLLLLVGSLLVWNDAMPIPSALLALDLALAILTLVVCALVVLAKTPRQYHIAQQLAKFAMLFGILTIPFVCI